MNKRLKPVTIVTQVELRNTALFSSCRSYRYLLWRTWAEDWETNFVMFVGLNPSTADENTNDQTIRRCIGFAQSWGYSGLCMANLFAYRATDPAIMRRIVDPIGPENDAHLVATAEKAKLIVAAWGNHGTHRQRHLQVKALLPSLHCLRLTKTGMPSHPLRLPADLTPIAL